MTSGRTLDIMGTKKIFKSVQSVAATTHSYTIQPVISADGQLLSPMFVCWQERTGEFGPHVREEIAQLNLSNLYTVASKSGELDKRLMIEWFDNVFFPTAPIESFLYLDSWSCYKDRKAIDKVTPGNKKLHILQILPRTTRLAQPLDVFFFRTWKQYMHNIFDHVSNHDLPYQLTKRSNVLQLLSLIHNQFCAPAMRDFIRYAWHKSGYLSGKPKFINPIKVAFDIKVDTCIIGQTRASPCHGGGFIKCLWCETEMCFKHFFGIPHMH